MMKFQFAANQNFQLQASNAITDLFICRDIAINDTTAANLALHQCRLKTI